MSRRDENDELELSSDQPIDDIASNLMQTIARQGRGFTLGLLAPIQQRLAPLRQRLLDYQRDIADEEEGKDGVRLDITAMAEEIDDLLDGLTSPEITVKESLPPHDEWEAPAAYRKHTIEDTGSFIQYAKAYGTAEKSLIFYNETGCTLTIDESRDRGLHEVIAYTFVESPDFKDWSGMLGKDLDHRSLMLFLMHHEHTLIEPQILLAMQSMKINAQVNVDSEIMDDGGSVGFFVKTNAGDDLKKFPKTFRIRVPVLDQDTVDEKLWVEAQVKLQITLPEDPKEGAQFLFVCPLWRQIKRQRVQKEGESIAFALDQWKVIHGSKAYAPRSLPTAPR